MRGGKKFHMVFHRVQFWGPCFFHCISFDLSPWPYCSERDRDRTGLTSAPRLPRPSQRAAAALGWALSAGLQRPGHPGFLRDQRRPLPGSPQHHHLGANGTRMWVFFLLRFYYCIISVILSTQVDYLQPKLLGILAFFNMQLLSSRAGEKDRKKLVS